MMYKKNIFNDFFFQENVKCLAGFGFQSKAKTE